MNVFEEGKVDARQSEDKSPERSLFRKRYRQLDESEVALHDAIKDKADELARLIASVSTTPKVKTSPTDIIGTMTAARGANVTLSLRHLEDCVYRAVKALTT